MELPIDHFRLLGISPSSGAEEVLRAFQLRLDRAPNQGFTYEVLAQRSELLRLSADLLSDEAQRKSYEIALPDSLKQTKVLRLFINISVILCAYVAYFLILTILSIFPKEYARFTVRWQHVMVVFGNIPFLPLIAYYLIDIEEKHSDSGLNFY